MIDLSRFTYSAADIVRALAILVALLAVWALARRAILDGRWMDDLSPDGERQHVRDRERLRPK